MSRIFVCCMFFVYVLMYGVLVPGLISYYIYLLVFISFITNLAS